jgi:hypothetical protein
MSDSKKRKVERMPTAAAIAGSSERVYETPLERVGPLSTAILLGKNEVDDKMLSRTV